MDKKDKPSWMRNFDDTYAAPFAPGYWNKPMVTNGGTKAADTHGGYRLANAHAAGGRRGHSDTSSLYSRYTTSSSGRSDRKRSRRTALCIVLTVIALIIAALIGLLVYYLFMMGRPKDRELAGVEGSVRVLNLTYHDDMANTSSEAFRHIAQPFCAELDSYVARSNYSDQFEGCEVTSLRNVADVSDCLCLGAKKGNVMVVFHLRFNGSHEEGKLKKDVYRVIENGVSKVHFDDVIYVLLKHFLVDIRHDWRKPYDAIEADVTLPVYNLNYSQSMTNNQSEAFLSLATPFCREVDDIMTNEEISWLTTRYTTCRVTGFSQQTPDKGSVAFTLLFEGREPRPLQQGLLYILLSGARTVEWHSQLLKMIGSLIVTPFGPTNHLRPVNETKPQPNLTYLHVSLPVFNLTLTPELGDPRSPYYINLTTGFCQAMAKYYRRSSLSDRFHNCKVLGFTPNPTSVEMRLGFGGEPWPGLPESVRVVIRAHAPDRLYSVLHLYRVGDLDVILDRISANGLELHTSLRVTNLTFTSDLQNSDSPEFLHHAVLFCKDLEDFYAQSALADRFMDCGVKSFSPKPVRVHFYLLFKGTSLTGLTSSHIDVIKRHAQKVPLNAGWTAYLVGDLLVLPEFQPHSVYPTNITFTITSTTTDIRPTSTMNPPGGDWTKAIINAHLYNFTFDPEVLDPGSVQFKSLQQHFCDDVSRVYLNSFLSLPYRGCKIQLFRPTPDEVVLHLYFDLPVSSDLEWSIGYVLENRSPKVNLTLDDLHLIEVIHLGDLFLTPREITLESTPSTSIPLPSPSSKDVSPTMTSTMTMLTSSSVMMSSTEIVNPPGPDNNVTLRYPLFNFTFPTGVGDPESPVFRHYQRLFCLEIQEIFKASRNFYLLYEGCGINHFGYDDMGVPYVDFYVMFNTGYTDLLHRETIDTLEGSRDHLHITIDGNRVFEVMPIDGLLLLLANSTVTSSWITSSMIETTTSDVESTTLTSSVYNDGVLVILYYEAYQLNHTSELDDRDSASFLHHRQKVCSDIQRWFGGENSPFYLTYHGCELASFSSSPEGVTFTVLLRTDVIPGLGNHVRNFLEEMAPKRKVPGYQLLEVGDLLLIVNRSRVDVIPTPLPSDSYTGFTLTPVTSLITMTSTIEPTPTTSDVEPSSSLMLLTLVSLQFGLADFYFTPDLHNIESSRFKALQNEFCADMERFYRNSPLRDFYRDCHIDEFIETEPNQPQQVVFTLQMMMPPTRDHVKMTIDTILSQSPQLILDGYYTIRAGDLFLILTDWKEVLPDLTSTTTLPSFTGVLSTFPSIITTTTTTEPASSSAVVTTTPETTTPDPRFYLRMSFELKNMTWTSDLGQPMSERFRRHDDLFCAELNEFLPRKEDKDFRRYMDCKIDAFHPQPLRVNFSLQFDSREGLDLERIQRLVVSLIKEHAMRDVYNHIVVYKIGDLLIDIDTMYIHDNTTITTVNIFDAIAFEFNYTLYSGNFSAALLDPASYEFRVHAYEICADMDAIFEKLRIRNIRNRYLRCYVNSFSNGASPSVIFTLDFNGTDVIDPERINGIIVYSHQSSDGAAYFPVGKLLLSSTEQMRWYFIKQEFYSTHPYPYTTPAVVTYIKIQLEVFSPQWSAQLADASSAYYKAMTESFCQAVTGWIEPEIPDYESCEVLKISDKPVTVEADLLFLGEQKDTLRRDVDTILLESPDREQFGNVIGLRMGRFFMYEESLVLDQRTVSNSASGVTSPFTNNGAFTTSGSGDGGVSGVTPVPTPTEPPNPCLQGGGSGFHRHPTLCDRWVQCTGGGGAFIEIPCAPGSVFLDMQCMAAPPGFQCTPAAG